MYEFLMEIGFIFKDGEKGKRIVGGADTKYSCENLDWLNFKGKNVMIRTKKGFIYLKVKKIDIFPSIAGALNIGLTLYDNEKFDLLNIGDKVYKCE